MLGVVYAAVAAMLFGSAYVATAFQLRSFTPLDGALWRAGLASFALGGALAVARLRRPRPVSAALPGTGPSAPMPAPLARLARLAVLGALGGLFFLVGMNLAVSIVGATITSFVAGLYAVLAAVLAPLVLGERLERAALAGFGVALAGAALLAELDPARASAAGLVAGLVAATCFALFLVLSRRWSRQYRLRPELVSLSNLLVTVVGLLVIVGLTDPARLVPAALRPEAAVALVWLAIAAIGGQLLVVASVRRIDARRSSSFLLLNPVTATILSALLLGEVPSPVQLLGGALVLVGMGLATGALAPIARAARHGPATVEPKG